jgi:hypothetical protein
MRRFYRVVMTSGLLLLLGACAKTTAFEPQDQTLDARLSRIYFFRKAGTVADAGGIATAEVRVDGKVIGSLVPGTTLYIIADRAQGTHKLTVHRAGESAGFEADAQIEDATSHYFEIGPVVEANIDQARLDAMGLKGHPMPGRFVASSPFMLYALDPIAGAGVITKLKSEPSLRLEPPSCETSPLPNAPSQLPEC